MNANSTAVLLTAPELAELLRISIRSLWRRKSAGELPKPVWIGGAVRWPLAVVQDWIAAGCPKQK